MARPVTMFTGQWADLPLEELAAKMQEFGYDGLELACWGDHFEVGRALAEDDYCDKKRELLQRYNLQCYAISSHLVGQAVLDVIDSRHESILTPEIWGDGEQTRSFLYIDECLEGVRRLMKSDFAGPVNIGSDELISINNLARLAMKFANKELDIHHIDGPVGVRGRCSDNTLIDKKLG